MPPMEYTSITSNDAASLASSLTEKSAEGWAVVGIAGHGSSISAILSREGGSAAAADSATSASSAPSYEPASTPGADSSGWGATASPAAPSSPVSSVPSYDPGPSSAPAAAPSYTPAPASATPAVPAGWYADPAGRFELRYWDGGAWTEHVSRAGQQYTDPPVA